jgi:hypothetical protein
VKNIVAAQFDDFTHADAALRALGESGMFASQDLDQIVLGAPGRHDRHPLGGDEDADVGAAKGNKGAALGAAAGAATGMCAGAVLGPLGVAAGAAVGAYGGSFAGALGGMGESSAAAAPPPRPAGVMVSAHVRNLTQRNLALQLFHANGARSVEEAEGLWREGTWANFNPVATPHWLMPPSALQTPVFKRK